MGRNEKYWIKNARETSNLCLSRIFIPIGIVLVFSVFNVSEKHDCVNTRINTFREVEETMHVYNVRNLSKTPHLIYV